MLYLVRVLRFEGIHGVHHDLGDCTLLLHGLDSIWNETEDQLPLS